AHRSAQNRPAPHRDLPPFPTRRSSDLLPRSLPAQHDDGARERPLDLPATLPAPVAPLAAREGRGVPRAVRLRRPEPIPHADGDRSEEHTSELQSRENLVCRLLLEKKKK